MSKESFKSFIKDRPELANSVLKGLGKVYMNYMIYMEKILLFGISLILLIN